MISTRHADLLDHLDNKTYGIIAFVYGDDGVQISFRQEVSEIVNGTWMGNKAEYTNRQLSASLLDNLAAAGFQRPQAAVHTIFKNFPAYNRKKGIDYVLGFVTGMTMQWGFSEPVLKVSGGTDNSMLLTFSKT